MSRRKRERKRERLRRLLAEAQAHLDALEEHARMLENAAATELEAAAAGAVPEVLPAANGNDEPEGGT